MIEREVHVLVAKSYFLKEPAANVPDPTTYQVGVTSRKVLAFVNAVAWIANQENHHPDLEIGYNYCHITLMTHALKGLSMNDFICAAKFDRLLVA